MLTMVRRPGPLLARVVPGPVSCSSGEFDRPVLVVELPLHCRAPDGRCSIVGTNPGVIMNPLTGREDARPVLGGLLDAVAQGTGGCLVVEGPVGAGKTHLLKAMSRQAAERGLTVAAGRAGESDAPAPIALLVNLLGHLMPEDVDPGELLRPDTNPFWLTDRVGELVGNAARRRPLVLVLDDAQRLDDAGGLALRGLVQSLASSPVLWLLARRPLPARSLGQQALGWLIEHAAVRCPLGTLDRAAVAELCGRVLGAEPGASVLRWADRCGGNPWLVEELLHAFREAGQVLVVDGRASVVAERLPETVLGPVGRLLDELSPAVRRLLVTGGRTGGTFTVEDVAAALGEPAAELSASVEEALTEGFVRAHGPELTFTQEVLGEALAHPSFARTGRELPVRAAEAPTPPLAAAPLATPSAAKAPRTPRCGCDDLATRALSALGNVFDEVPRTLAGALRLLAGSGRAAEAVRLAKAALRPGAEPAAEAQLVLELSRGLRDAGHPGLSAGLVRRTLTRQDLGEPEHAALREALTESGRTDDSAPAAAEPWGDERGETGPGAPADGPAVEPARQALSPTGCEVCERPLWTWLVRALVAADRFDAARAVGEAVKREAETFGETWPQTLWYGHHAELLVAEGRMEEARVAAETALRSAGRTAPADSVPARLVLARLSLHRGDLATASDQLRMTERLVTDGPGADRARLDWALALFHAASGRPPMTVRTLLDADGRGAPDPLLFGEAPQAAAMLVRLARQAGLGTEAERAAGFARRLADRNPAVRSLTGAAEHAEGVLRDDVVALHRAVELHRHAARPLAAGSALEDAAKVEQGMGNTPRTVRLLESALGLYADCGAQRDTVRVQKKLRRLGVQHERGPGAERPKSGWESLTSAELRVVRAVVDGKTNREAASSLFLSPHTVDSHLRRVFSKLDINSRVELTRHFLAHEVPVSGLAAARRPGSAG
ncbi:AAA family ATPase [Streptomyces sp. NPDC058739]|uniref:AAA family ATPase n=1 Tax=Streptomyces sp. NPDC058739 TaxID=3346618 RepID=UPI0036BD7E62